MCFVCVCVCMGGAEEETGGEGWVDYSTATVDHATMWDIANEKGGPQGCS